MLTSRAWWLIVVSLLMLIMGMLSSQPVVALLGLTIGTWVAIEAVLFSLRSKYVFRQLKLRRVVRDDRGPVTSLWAGRTFEVSLSLRVEGPLGLPYVAFEEMTPYGLEILEGEPRGEGAISPGEPLHARYRVKSPHAGSARFEGVRVQMADLQGLFYHAGFVHLETTYRILPPFVDAEGKTATGKRYNLLPPPGIHRLARPGAGSELLDLRDYIPGDPPKTIAWKVSARRDRLITKEYESEVPVRCTLFIDTSQSVRLGPPGSNALTRLVEIAAGVSQANLASRDLTGLCLFDEHGTRIVKPSRSRRHLIQILNELAAAAGQPAAAGHAPIEQLMPLAYSFALEVYPEQLAPGVNNVPGWLPYFVPVPGPWLRRPTFFGRLLRWTVLPVLGVVYFWVFYAVFQELADHLEEWDEAIRTFIAVIWLSLRKEDVSIVGEDPILPSLDLIFLAFVVLALMLFPLWNAFWRDVLPLLFSPHRRRLTRMRKKLAALFSTRYDLGAGGIELLLQDDTHFSAYLGRFLAEHHIPHTPQVFDRHGHYLFRSTAKLDHLSAALLRAVGKGHDNELFVLLVDVVELEKDLEPLLKAVKVALARHHQVMLIVPWPPELESPRRETAPQPPNPTAEKPKETKKRRGRRPNYSRMTLGELREHIKKLMTRRYQRAYHRVSKKFAGLHIPVLCATDTAPIPLILDRLDRLRGVRRRR